MPIGQCHLSQRLGEAGTDNKLFGLDRYRSNRSGKTRYGCAAMSQIDRMAGHGKIKDKWFDECV